jgi:hypothetical protein
MAASPPANIDLAAALAEAEELYRARNPKSLAQHRAACEAMPGGNTRSAIPVDPFPLTMARGEGARLWDLDGHEYTDFLKLCLENADLRLLRPGGSQEPATSEQQERKFALFNILISLFERAYIIVYEDEMDRQTRRLWQSWEDFIGEWCRREDFRAALPTLLQGEDEDFVRHITRLAAAEQARTAA